MTYAKEGKRESLKYCLLGKKTNLDLWGHEYMRYPILIQNKKIKVF